MKPQARGLGHREGTLPALTNLYNTVIKVR